MDMLGIDIAKQEDSTVLTFSNGSSIRLINNKTTNVRGLRSNLISLICTYPKCGDEYWKEFDLRYESLPSIVDNKYMLECGIECMK